jgi:cell division protein FtsI (penicillin-binding protein 3)
VADQQASSRFQLTWKGRLLFRSRKAAPAGVPDWRATVRSRLLVSTCVLGLWTVGIEARLIYLQVFQHSEMVARANRQRENTLDAPARRGDIVDRNGRVVAYSVDADSIFGDPSEVDDPATAAAELCRALNDCDAAERQSIEKNLRRKGQFAYVARKVTPDEEERVRALQLKGIGVIKESRRFYPKRELMAHVVGYVGADNLGLGGLESAFDSQIRGRSGKVIIQRDARRSVLTSRVKSEATAGVTLELTLDQYLQNIAERELEAGVIDNRAAGGCAVIMDPNTGEILALANYPVFNPNVYSRFSDQHRRNRCIQDLYEPGSTFKVVTAGAALEEGLMTPDDQIDVSAGMIRFGSRVIPDMHRYGVLSFADVIVKSSNVGAIKIGREVGAERLTKFITRFGFGQLLLPDFKGENPGIVWNPAKLDPSALASVSMGYQVGVTPVQMATAVSSVANGGSLYEPRVVRATIKDGRREEVPHKILRRTISERTAAQLTAIMEGVVEKGGTASSAMIPGYTIAGKTGTAHKLVDGRYSPSEYNASFVGFIPSRKPALTIIVLIDSPHGRGYTGGVVAAPIFKRIAEASMRHLGIAPTVNAPPPVLVASHQAGTDAVEARRVKTQVDIVPAAVEAVANGLMPDLRGLSARDALRALTRVGLSARLDGAGFVVEQSPAAGTPVIPGGPCTLKLGRHSQPTAAPGAPQ